MSAGGSSPVSSSKLGGIDLDKAAACGEPSHVWRAGQERRLEMILRSAGERVRGRLLDDGCGVGIYVQRLEPHVGQAVGMEFDFERAAEARLRSERILSGAGEALPFPCGSFDLVLSHEVLEHVQDDRAAAGEIARVLKPGGRAIVFLPNRGYPFETHGIYWGGRYRFGNIPLVNWLPRLWRDRLAPHVRVYTAKDVERLFSGLPFRTVERTVIYGAYDNIIRRYPAAGKVLRAVLQGMERTPLKLFGLSHFWVLEKVEAQPQADPARGSSPSR